MNAPCKILSDYQRDTNNLHPCEWRWPPWRAGAAFGCRGAGWLFLFLPPGRRKAPAYQGAPNWQKKPHWGFFFTKKRIWCNPPFAADCSAASPPTKWLFGAIGLSFPLFHSQSEGGSQKARKKPPPPL